MKELWLSAAAAAASVAVGCLTRRVAVLHVGSSLPPGLSADQEVVRYEKLQSIMLLSPTEVNRWFAANCDETQPRPQLL